MYVSFVKAVDRKTGKVKTLAEVVTITHDQLATGKVRDVWRELNATTEKGRELRRTYLHAVCFMLNTSQGTRTFKDKDTVAEKAKREEAAQELRDKQDAAKQAAEATKAAMVAAIEEAARLGIQVDNPELDAKVAQLEAERDALAKKLADLQKQPGEEGELKLGAESSAPASPVAAPGSVTPPPDN